MPFWVKFSGVVPPRQAEPRRSRDAVSWVSVGLMPDPEAKVFVPIFEEYKNEGLVRKVPRPQAGT